MCDILREEFRVNKLGFIHNRPETFYLCQWEWHPMVFLALKWFLALYSAAALIIVCVQSVGDSSNIMIFLTIWTYILLTLHMWTTAILALHWLWQTTRQHSISLSSTTELAQSFNSTTKGLSNHAYDKTKGDIESCEKVGMDTAKSSNTNQHPQPGTSETVVHNDSLKWYMKVSWFLANVVQTFSLVVTIIYFGAIYPQQQINGSQGDVYNDINMHALNSVFVLIDLAINARPVRFLHVLHAISYGFLYVLFSVIYWSGDKANHVIYANVLDYNKAPIAIGVILGLTFVVLPLIQLGLFGLYRLRLHIFKKVYNKDY